MIGGRLEKSEKTLTVPHDEVTGTAALPLVASAVLLINLRLGRVDAVAVSGENGVGHRVETSQLYVGAGKGCLRPRKRRGSDQTGGW